MRILGIDPGLQKTGWGIIESEGHALRFVACGLIKSNPSDTLPERLRQIDSELTYVVEQFRPDSAAVEETFMNNNAASALKLGQARGVTLVVPARLGVPVSEYSANLVKKSIVGAGHAAKDQIGMMVRTLLPACKDHLQSADDADALAIAICHAHHAASQGAIQRGRA